MVFNWGIGSSRSSPNQSGGSKELDIEESSYRHNERKRRLAASEPSSPIIVQKKNKTSSIFGHIKKFLWGHSEQAGLELLSVNSSNMNGHSRKGDRKCSKNKHVQTSQQTHCNVEEDLVCTYQGRSNNTRLTPAPDIRLIKDTTHSPMKPVVTLNDSTITSPIVLDEVNGTAKKLTQCVIELQDESDVLDNEEIEVISVRSPSTKTNRLDISAISRQIVIGVKDDDDNVEPDLTNTTMSQFGLSNSSFDLLPRSAPRLPFTVYSPVGPAPLILEKKGSVPANLRARSRLNSSRTYKKSTKLGEALKNIGSAEQKEEEDEEQGLERYRKLVAQYGGIVVDKKKEESSKQTNRTLQNRKNIFKRSQGSFLTRVRNALDNAGSRIQSRSTSPEETACRQELSTPCDIRAVSPAYSVTSSIASSRVSERHSAVQARLVASYEESKSSEFRVANYTREYEQRRKRISILEEEAKIKQADRKLKSRDGLEDLRRRLELTGIHVPKPEIEEEVDEFPELPGNALALVASAWDRRRNPGEKFTEAYDIPITRKDLATLSGLNWLNDEVINFYMNMIVQRSTRNSKLPKTYAFNTFFYANIAGARGYASVKRWTKKVDIFSYDILLVPVHLQVHWCMAVIDIGQKRIDYYDSLFGQNKEAITLLKDYLEKESMDKKNTFFSFDGWSFNLRDDIPAQKNGSDCGVFACRFAEYASRRAKIVFSQQHMPYFRQRMVWEICQNSLINS